MERACCCRCRQAWLLPVLRPLLAHMLRWLSASWGELLSHSGQPLASMEGGATLEDPAAASEDVVKDR